MNLPAAGFRLKRDVMPLFRGTYAGRIISPTMQCGTAFLIGPRKLITCWHCVRDDLGKDEVYFVADETGGSYRPMVLSQIRQAASGADIALAQVEMTQSVELRLGDLGEAAVGVDVITYGYPLTNVTQGDGGTLRFSLGARFLQGYITRGFEHETEFGSMATFELDMPAPAGLSGSPLIRMGSRDVVGMIYGSLDVGTIDQVASVDPETGERIPEVVRLLSFGLALHTSLLRDAIAEFDA